MDACAIMAVIVKEPEREEQMINAFDYFRQIPMRNVEVDVKKALEIAWDYKIYAYDACYLEASKRLNLSLLTFDSNMIKVGRELGITILGGENACF